MSTIAVIGATGNIGSRLVQRLATSGHQVRAISRSPHTGGDNIEPVAVDLVDAEQAVHALDGVDAAYLTSILAGDDPLATERTITANVVDAATKHHLGHVVMHTAVQADRGDTGALLLDNKTGLERALVESGVPYTILRPAWFMQNLWAARDYLEQGVVSFPWPGEMSWAATDINDIVSLAATFLERGPANRGFDVHVPGGISGDQIAEAASRVLGRDVGYQRAAASTREYVDAFPVSEAHKDIYADLFDHFTSATYEGDPTAITAAVEGFTPRSIEDFLRDELFATG